MDNNFYTFTEYMKNRTLTASEEDYVEMIYRLCIKNNGYTRVNDLANALNVKPPSVSNMLKRLTVKSIIKHVDYGTIELTEEGTQIGTYLLKRHNIIERFLQILNPSTNLLEETEKIEHTLSKETILSLSKLVSFFNDHNETLQKLNMYLNEKEY